MSKQPKTLLELDVKAGDVVKCVSGGLHCDIGREYTVSNEIRVNGYGVGRFNVSKFLIVSRATPQPILWRDMTDAEKGALLLAKHEGRVIDVFLDGVWENRPAVRGFLDSYAYRIKPTPKVVTHALRMVCRDTGMVYRGTYTTTDGKPDLTSIKMEEP